MCIKSRNASFLSRCSGTSASGRAHGPGLHAPFVPKWRLRAPLHVGAGRGGAPAPGQRACRGVPRERGHACVLLTRELGESRYPQRGVLIARPVPALRRVEAVSALVSAGGRKHVPSPPPKLGPRGVGAAGCQNEDWQSTLRRSVCWGRESGEEALLLSAREARHSWVLTLALLPGSRAALRFLCLCLPCACGIEQDDRNDSWWLN